MTFGDVRDTLVSLPAYGHDGYAIQDGPGLPLFPVRAELARILEPESVFEFGAYLGYCLVAFVVGAEGSVKRVGWVDAQINIGESNLLCRANLRSVWKGSPFVRLWSSQAAAFGQADLVQVDGDHTYGGCMLDLIYAYRLDPRIITVDDYTAIASVKQATDDFARAHSLTGFYVPTVNGVAVLECVGFVDVRPELEQAGYPTLDLEE